MMQEPSLKQKKTDAITSIDSSHNAINNALCLKSEQVPGFFCSQNSVLLEDCSIVGTIQLIKASEVEKTFFNKMIIDIPEK